jgi:uncharacterized protein (TIGR00299 family) protein
MKPLKLLYFDCFSGASGDMILGALIDAGVPLDDVRRALGSLALDPETVWTERVMRSGIRATKFCVRGEDAPREHAHPHEQSHRQSSAGSHREASEDSHRPASGDSHRQASGDAHRPASGDPHRTLAEISQLIDGSALSSSGKDRAKQLFLRLGEAEAEIHGTSLAHVHLHEVGAIDSIVDIVGVVYAMEALGVDAVVSSPLNVGGGMVQSAHGRYPVPAPATLKLLHDTPTCAPIYSDGRQVELVTPTGALLITSYASQYGPVPRMTVRATGYGAGTRDFENSPNVLRVLVGEGDSTAPSQTAPSQTAPSQTAPSQTIVTIEAEIDDMNPQIFGRLMERLLADGALDVFYTAIQMKKNRPGTLLTVIAAPERRELLASIVFRETTTIGVRYREMQRECLDRETVSVATPFGSVRIKVARQHGEVLNASPEFDDCVRLATAHGRPVKEIQAQASKAFMELRP